MKNCTCLIGVVLRDIRLNRTQMEVAELAGMNVKSISSFENARRKNVKIMHLARILSACGVTFSEFFARLGSAESILHGTVPHSRYRTMFTGREA